MVAAEIADIVAFQTEKAKTPSVGTYARKQYVTSENTLPTEASVGTTHLPTQDPDTKIFDGSARLEQIRNYARWRRLSPTALLACTLAHVACALPPTYTVDAGKGPGSLNLFVAAAAPSSGGKSRVMREGGKVVEISGGVTYAQLTPGSGEGLITAYQLPPGAKEDQQQDGPPVSVLWQEEEILNLGALKDRKGATLQGFLTKMYDGGNLSVTNKFEQYGLEESSYRAAFILGVQPGKADILLQAADQGFPQRFLWTQITDPGRQRGYDYPEVSPVHLKIPEIPGNIIQACETPRRVLLEDDDRKLIDGDFQGLDGHGMFTRLKVAALIAILREHPAMEEDDWERAGYLMAASDRARKVCVEYKTEAARKARRAQEHEEDQAEVELMGKVQEKVLHHLEGKRGEWVNGGTISRGMSSSRYRGEPLNIMLGRLAELGQIQARTNPERSNSIQYCLP